MHNTDNTKYTISTGNTNDIDAITQFQVEMAQESEGTQLDYDRVHRGVTAVMNDAAKGTYLVARKNGEAVGSLMITREWSDWNSEWYWWIQSVYVKPAYRHNGIYRMMYAHVKSMARAHKVSQIRLYVDKSNCAAQQVYNKLGMQECHYLMYEECIDNNA